MNKIKALCLVVVVSLLAACATTNQDIGTITGGAVGAILGSQVGHGSGRSFAIATGTLAGALIGNRIGQYMDRQDRMYFSQALEREPDGHTRAWQNPNTHHRYRVTPTKTYYRKHRGHRQPCRRYVTTAIIDGKAQKITGRACRMPNGTWRVA